MMTVETDPTTRTGTDSRWVQAAVVVLLLVGFVAVVSQWVLLSLGAVRQVLGGSIAPANVGVGLFSLALAFSGGAVVFKGGPRRYGWLMLASGVFLGVNGLAGPYALYAWETGQPLGMTAVFVADLWMVNFLLVMLLTPALFPDGAVASARWRRPVRLAAMAWVALIAVFAVAQRPASDWFEGLENAPTNPAGFLPIPEIAYQAGWALISLFSLVVASGSMIARWRRADFEMRQRMKWVLVGFGLLLTAGALQLIMGVLGSEVVDVDLADPLDMLSTAASVGLAVALGLAVLRYRLYDVDLVIRRTIVYGVLTVLILGIYVGLVVGVGAVLPVDQTFLALTATAVAAVAFAPLREWLQARINRLLFGRRDDPYAVLSEMGRLMADIGTPERTLQRLTEVMATSLKLPGVSVDLAQTDGGWYHLASHGTFDTDRDGVGVIPLRHQGELVGRLIAMPRSVREPFSQRDLALLEDVAHQAGAIAHSVQLRVALQRARERLVLAREEERRRIRRDLHDGLGPALASQTFGFDEVLDCLHADPDRAIRLVTALKAQNRDLVADIRRLVYELRPPAIDELGVAGALVANTAQIQESGPVTIEVTTQPDPLPPLPAAVEVAAYRIAREAILNTIRHAGATRCTATLAASEEDLTIAVRDDGSGIAGATKAGVGLISMRERSEELGGSFRAVSQEAGGTEILVTLPLRNVWDSGGHD